MELLSFNKMSQEKEIIGTIVTVNISPLLNGKAKMSWS